MGEGSNDSRRVQGAGCNKEGRWTLRHDTGGQAMGEGSNDSRKLQGARRKPQAKGFRCEIEK
jgi:hypothetical protein